MTIYDRFRPPAWAVDVAIVFALAIPALIQVPFVGGYERFSVVLLLPLLIRRTWPVASFMAFSALCALQLRLVDYPVWGDVGLFVALASIARYGPRWARWAGLAVGLAAAVLGPGRWTNAFSPRPFGTIEDLYPVLLAAAVVVASWIYGDLRRTRANYVAELEERAVRLAVERDQQAVIAAAAERQRIAREMHDVVAHSLSVIVVQADGGRFAAGQDPAAALRSLETIASTGREAMSEMRRLLGLLRSGDVVGSVAPQPGTADLDELVATVAGSGMHVTLSIEGSPAYIDQGTGLTVFRIVQEGLTNSIKHAGPNAKARVRVNYGTDKVVVDVVDDGRGAGADRGNDDGSASNGSGHGLIGMRERVELHGGSLVARPAPGGGFEVRATLPRVGEPA
jgi:signal transduction histidine kinase